MLFNLATTFNAPPSYWLPELSDLGKLSVDFQVLRAGAKEMKQRQREMELRRGNHR